MATFVLVHGAFHGGWCWAPVAGLLREAGHKVRCPTLLGLGGRAAMGAGNVTLSDQIDGVVQRIQSDDLTDLVLVGHSFGGMVVTGVADRCRERIRRVIYLDAFVPESGQSVRELLPLGMFADILAAVHSLGNGRALPPIFPAERFVDLTGEALVDFQTKLRPQPFLTFIEPVYLRNPPHTRRTFIYCSGRAFGLFDPFARLAKADDAWAYHDLPTHHDAMITDPRGLATLLTATDCLN